MVCISEEHQDQGVDKIVPSPNPTEDAETTDESCNTRDLDWVPDYTGAICSQKED